MDILCDFWFKNREYWFNGTAETDEKVIEFASKYFNFKNLENTKLISVKELSLLGQILFHDQIIRHKVRFDVRFDNLEMELSKSIIETNNLIAIEITNHLLKTKKIENLNPTERCFALMPLRHSSNEEHRIYVIKIIETFLEEEPKNSDYLRFYQASLERVRNPRLVIKDLSNPVILPRELICETSIFNDIKFDFDDNMDDNIYQKFTLKDIPEEFVIGFLKAIPDKETKNITISISGGSDSMLCLFLAVKLGYNPVALMIDYGNRLEHTKEIQFVSWFCEKLKVPFYVREIKELKRERDETREFYERVTKNIRFNSYKFLGFPVVLGHNLDDCFENCITNILTQRAEENLFGMKPVNDQLGVSLRRPILGIPKSNIVEICNWFSIPFLLDSTPKWSRRGKIRDNIVPAFKVVDENLITRMMEFCQKSSQTLQDYQTLLLSIPIKKIKDGYSIDINIDISLDGFNTNFRFWQGILNRITKMSGIEKIKDKTITHFISTTKEYLEKEKFISRCSPTEIKISLLINLTAHISTSRNEILFIIKK
jgi:tRNA(Ile)-lysidine synthase TilS/MesJ